MEQEASKNRILLSAIRLISKHGYDKVTISMIAEDVGITGSAIYRFYGSKALIFQDVIAHIQETLPVAIPTKADIREQLKKDTPRAVLRQYFYTTPELVPASIELLRICFKEILTKSNIPDFIDKIMFSYKARIQSVFDYMVELNAIPPTDTKTLAEIWAGTRLVFSVWYAHQLDAYIGHYRLVIELFLDILTKGMHLLECPEQLCTEPGQDCSGPFGPQTTKSRIICAASYLFCEYGFEKTTIAQIAQKAGISAAAVYKHFENKNTIEREILLDLNRYYKRIGPVLGDKTFDVFLRNRDNPALIKSLASSYIFPSEMQNRLYRFVFYEQFRKQEVKYVYMGSVDESRQELASRILALAADGVIPACDHYSVATIFVFVRTYIHITNAIFQRTWQQTEDFRIRAAVTIASYLVNGLG